ncbi:hypothetical protein [Bradyrhizobium sp. CCBAU 53421]|uniref:hypothetical protein n=1 Tax=Bradyrhizobium sp. CCBAU 53421 TaxID=1325120 RepID=UPI00188A799E|nr:hypothetical protein [Bradyrhizobium sp. CCBAU 53421]
MKRLKCPSHLSVEHDPEKCEAAFRKDHAQTKRRHLIPEVLINGGGDGGNRGR